ncbi:hypothetical protein HZS_3832 [Henneguya salminicola]|nr:hypothetical protein HZS_3832 [Henneguya salminicola]
MRNKRACFESLQETLMETDNLFTPAFVTEVYINECLIKMEVNTGSPITVIGMQEVKSMNLCLRSTNAIFKSFT